MKNDNKQLLLNLFASTLAFFINAAIQFAVIPVLTKSIGDEAYGFITIANDFVSYGSIVAVILNSVASRFISVEIHRGNIRKAEEYFSSVFFGNIIIATGLAIAGTYIVFRFDTFLEVSNALRNDVSILFSITFINYLISIIISVFSVCIYVKNRIDISSSINIVSYLIKLAITISLFVVCAKIKVYFMAIATLISTVFLGISHSIVSRKLLPEIRIKLTEFKPRIIRVLIQTGAWMTINNLSNVISGNITTIILNINISANAAGFYSVARAIPNAINSFIYAVYSIFVPTFYRLYAEGKKEELINYSKTSMKIMEFVCSVPIFVICVKAVDILSLWQPFRASEEIIEMAKLLIVFSLICLCYASVLPLSQLGLVANKIKWQTIINMLFSCISLLLTILIVKNSDFGMLGIAVSSLIVQAVQWFLFVPVYSACVLDAPRLVFFKEKIRITVIEVITMVVLFIFGKLFYCYSWASLIIVCGCMCLLGYALLYCLLLSRSERIVIMDNVKRKLLFR